LPGPDEPQAVLTDGGGRDLEAIGHLAGAQAQGREQDEPGPEIDAECGLVGGPEAFVGGEPVLAGPGGFACEVFEGEDTNSGGASARGVLEIPVTSSAGAIGTEGAGVLDLQQAKWTMEVGPTWSGSLARRRRAWHASRVAAVASAKASWWRSWDPR